MKESYPIETAEYAVRNKIQEEPAFAWWAPHVLKKRDRIIGKMKSNRYWKKTHKYSVELPKTVKRALEIDRETGTDFWRKALDKEMKNVMVAFEFIDDDQVPIGYNKINGHMVFDIKMDLTRKCRYVANGNETEPPKEMTYSSVVSRDSVRIFFLLAALNDLEVLACDIQNAYLEAPTAERNYLIAGPEFGSNAGRPVLIVRALYGLRSSGAMFRAHCAQTLRDLGFKSSLADPDVWMKAATKPDGTRYYEYVLAYVDDICCCSIYPKAFMESLKKAYTLKKDSVKEPDLYLGADVVKWQLEKTDEPQKARWAFSSTRYTKRAIEDVERNLSAQGGKKLATKASSPLAAGYRLELDQTPELSDSDLTYYQGLIGVLRWICELGRIDILLPVSLMSRYLVAARSGHFDQVFHIFAYLKLHEKSTLVFDDTEPWVDEDAFHTADWSEFYPEAKEVEPPDMPEALGKPVVTSCFVDADHAGCRATRRSHTGVLIFVNRAPILWYSKRQTTVESSTFGSEIVALKTAIEMIQGLRYKLRMFGVEVLGPTNVYCDNNSVVIQTTKPESALKKKHAAVAYHMAREACASVTIRIAKEDGETNLADVLTKPLAGGKLKDLISRILW